MPDPAACYDLPVYVCVSGFMGEKGNQGAHGTKGSIGVNGVQGEKGEAGPVGPKGTSDDVGMSLWGIFPLVIDTRQHWCSKHTIYFYQKRAKTLS